MLLTQLSVSSFADAMCELPAESLSDSDEEELHHNIFDAFQDIVTNFLLGDRLEASLTEEEIERVGLCCHFRTGLPLREHVLSRNSFFTSPFHSAGQQAFSRQR